MKKILLLMSMFVFLASMPSAKALTVNLLFDGYGTAETPSTNFVGSGNWTNIMYAAVRVWTNIIQDNATVTIHCYWNPSIGYIAQSSLLTQGGTPNRITEGAITFNSSCPFYFDPTPLSNEEYPGGYTEESVTNLGGGGVINASRWLRGGPSKMDFFTVALHEIGHEIALDIANASFKAQAGTNNAIMITAPTPGAGAIIPLMTNSINGSLNGCIAYVSDRTLMSGSFAAGERMLPDDLSIIAIAQVGAFTNLNLFPQLGISHVPCDSHVTMSWIQPVIGQYILQQNADLCNPSGCCPVTGCSIVIINGTYTVTVPMTAGNCFFRLKRVG